MSIISIRPKVVLNYPIGCELHQVDNHMTLDLQKPPFAQGITKRVGDRSRKLCQVAEALHHCLVIAVHS